MTAINAMTEAFTEIDDLTLLTRRWVRVVDALFSALLAVGLGIWLDTPTAAATEHPVRLATGVTYETRDLHDVIDRAEGNGLVHLVRVDRRAARVRLWANDREASGFEQPYRAQPVWRHAKRRDALLTVNANRYRPPWFGKGIYLVGQRGWSGFTLGANFHWPLRADGPHKPALLIHKDGRAVLHRGHRDLNALPAAERPEARFAVLGDGILWGGRPADYLLPSRHPAESRTAIGVSADGWTLWLAVFQSASRVDVARALAGRGAHDAMLLDGGGSSSMVIRSPRLGDESGGLVHPALRPVATVLGLRFPTTPAGP